MLKDNPSIRLTGRAHKMSKSRGNVVNPDDVISQYGADSLRLYEMFMGPFRFFSLSYVLSFYYISIIIYFGSKNLTLKSSLLF